MMNAEARRAAIRERQKAKGRAIGNQRVLGQRLGGAKVTPALSGEPERFVFPAGHRRHEIGAHFEALGFKVENTPGYVIVTSRDINADAAAIEATPGARPILKGVGIDAPRSPISPLAI